MSRQLRRPDRRVLFMSSVVLPLYLAMSACGGGGGSEVASIPPPPPTPTPTPTPIPTQPPSGLLATVDGYSIAGLLEVKTSWLDSPATENGSYDVIGRLSLTSGNGGSSTTRVVTPGELAMSTNLYFGRDSGDVPTYSLIASQGDLPDGATSIPGGVIVTSWTINPTVAYRYDGLSGSTASQGLGQRLTAFDKGSDGSERPLFSYDFTRGHEASLQPLAANTRLKSTFDYDIGYSYVAMGEWSWGVVDLLGNAVTGSESGKLLFVDGVRTPSSGIPVSGTATYDARALIGGMVNVPFALTADFGQRSISTAIAQDYRYNSAPGALFDDGPLSIGVHVAGSAPFSNDGSFDIPLTGTVNYTYDNEPVAPPSEAVTGDMNGAFFGPNAEQVGGTFSIQRSKDPMPLYQDAFVGQQHH